MKSWRTFVSSSSHDQMIVSTEDNDSDVAMYNEGTSLDSCTGHSSADGQYHYHANLLCDQEAADPDTCKHIGYMRYKHAGEFVFGPAPRVLISFLTPMTSMWLKEWLHQPRWGNSS